jgi:hypothetical protein
LHIGDLFKISIRHELLMSTHASFPVDSVGPPRAEVCRTAASFPLGPVYFSGILGADRVNYRPTTKSRKLPNGPFTSQVFLGNFPAHPRTSRSAKLHARVSSPTRVPPCFCSWKRREHATDGDGRRRRRGKETTAGKEEQITTVPKRSSSGG